MSALRALWRRFLDRVAPAVEDAPLSRLDRLDGVGSGR